MESSGFLGHHEKSLLAQSKPLPSSGANSQFKYTFTNFYHPLVGELISKLNKDSIEGVFDVTWQDKLTQEFFDPLYKPSDSNLAKVISFPRGIDVEEHGPYANYNWEFFFHIPLTVAVHLSKTRRFAEAQRWFHFIFNPTGNDQSIEPPKRFWNFLAFRKDIDPKQIDYLLELLSKPPSDLDSEDLKRQNDILDGYRAMLDKPFQPHAVARTRHLAYQYSVVMKYLDNLIAWGDDLFQQDTVETINEATLLYVLAANILGPRPERVPPIGTVQAKTFAQLKMLSLDKMGNALVELEAAFPFNVFAEHSGGSDASGAGPLFGIGRTLYFCVPRNDKLLGYWDEVSDRLFKIRHCMNIEGVVRPLALFDPPLDPGMLVAAAAAGLDINSIVSGLSQPIGPIRSLTLIQKSVELAAEVRNLGVALLSAFEKGDAEQLALIRQHHEIQIGQMMQDVRFLQWKSAEESTTSLLTGRTTAVERLRYYQHLLGLPNDPNAADTITLNRSELTEESFSELYSKLVSQYDKQLTLQDIPPPALVNSGSPAQQSGTTGPGQLYLNKIEDTELNVHPPAARSDRREAMTNDTITGVLALIPDMGIDLHFWGLGGHANVFGGSLLSSAGRFFSSSKATSAADHESQGASATKSASYDRRAKDWILQYNLASRELMLNGRQILVSLISEQVARHDYLNTKQQLVNSQQLDQFLHDKFTNEQLYLWTQGELSKLYYEHYRFAFDTARKAEQAMKQELMRPELDAQNFLRFNYWDSGRKGLLSGEALHLDLKRMELAYHDHNTRELELTRHVSLRQLDPLQLLTLKFTGACQLTVPEWLYDRDCPGHYMRRIKNVAVSVPSVVGPYTSVNCTLSLLGSSIRKLPLLKDGEYSRQGNDDDRFVDYTGAVQSIVTSSASNDSGLFETNLRDERFLPFEGAGAVSTWKLNLPKSYPAFDYATISDVILHIRYTARQGIDPNKVTKYLGDLFAATSTDGASFALLFNLAQDFSTEWSASADGANKFQVTIKRDFFPYFTLGSDVTLTEFSLHGPGTSKSNIDDKPQDKSADLRDKGAFTLSIDTTSHPLFLIVRYSIKSTLDHQPNA